MTFHIMVLLILICLAVLSQWFALCSTVSTSFMNLKNIELTCETNPVELLELNESNFGNYLTCSRACKERPDCTSFMFTHLNVSSTSSYGRLGTCTFCPAYNMTGLNYSPSDSQMETWFRSSGLIVDPQSGTFLPTPGALSVGRLLVIKGRIPVPKPDRFIVDIFHNNKADIVVRISPRFDFKGVINTVMVSNKVNKTWKVSSISSGKFPFAEGNDFEINILSTREGFMVYAGEMFLRNVVETKYMANAMGYLRFEYTYVNLIYF